MAQGNLSGVAKSYRSGLEISAKLVAGDPSDTLWRGDLCVSNCKIASLLEKTAPEEALLYWREAHRILAAIEQKGLFVSAQEEKFLEVLRQKIGA